jgi:flavin reductase (DIM6/NTAB) family NADH-FMN oxidoreductase RutF
MTMSWHAVMEYSPSLIGCMITAANHSFNSIAKSKECVINTPEKFLIDKIVGIFMISGESISRKRNFRTEML